MNKDGKVLCLMCGRRLDGMFSRKHAPGCPALHKAGKAK